ncbi:hypothetical protein AD998_20800 [bacterium 336/3]|nr:hypothetical protein AD998_20800 [bacterium 336/3]
MDKTFLMVSLSILLIGMISCEFFSTQENKKENSSTSSLLKPILDSIHNYHNKQVLDSSKKEPTLNIIQEVRTIFIKNMKKTSQIYNEKIKPQQIV